ncbi:MAG TPA: 4-hydroxy-tetrahydrodipicolinate synthase [Polyangiaceae bacterium]|nr:4-hydroxy-tetrahydrodipicolinate synthase [Polyangiaceae bacterium]
MPPSSPTPSHPSTAVRPALRLEGTYTALVTPFSSQDLAVDFEAMDALIDAQVAGGVAGLVPCGTTGESPTLSHEEHALVIERTVQRAAKRVQVFAGAGSNSTREAIAMAQHAERVGADGLMIVVPYYNRPTQEGLVRHFVEVAGRVRVPIIVYNIPVRTGVDLLPESLARICAEAPNVVATKEATGNVLRAQRLTQLLGDRLVVLSGDDALTLPMIATGARGVISVTSNVLPAEVTRATRLALDGKIEEARRAHLALLPVHDAMFLEASPGPVKAALAARGLISDAVRSPLNTVSEATRRALAAALDTYARNAR